VVEVDGCAPRGSRSADRRRDEKLQRLGYRVLLVESRLVMRSVEAAVAVVRAALEQLRLRRRQFARGGTRNRCGNFVAFATWTCAIKGLRDDRAPSSRAKVVGDVVPMSPEPLLDDATRREVAR
jgi:hypothetical protein